MYPWERKRKKKEELRKLLRIAGLKLITRRNTSITLGCIISINDGKGTKSIVSEADNSIVYDKGLSADEAAKKMAKYNKEAAKKYPKLSTEEALAKYMDVFIRNNFETIKKLYIQRRKIFRSKGEKAIMALWLKKVKSVFLNKADLIKLLTKHLDEFPALIKGYNQAQFKTTIKLQSKLIEKIDEFSMSGAYDEFFKKRFGNPPDWKLPKNTIDVFTDYDDFVKFVKDALDFEGIPRVFDSEIKYIYNFLKNHLHKGDEFIIEMKNIYKTCGSCTREFMMLEDLLSSLGKKVTFIIHTDERIKGFSQITEVYSDIKETIKKYNKLYNKTKKK
ncbi:hypothetical protein C8N46_106151 [Kordia periserrulae]|uniref:Uncharacterized protein n=2 Tax=Kordia periserrulae TaxID=701523 RepID=A0A2T6BWU2_9FLAO|nr:hypothetical protein C8N46_106151 [Kordia periserrulae]